MTTTPRSLQALSALDQAAWTEALGGVYEHSPWIAAETWHARPFTSTDDLLGALQATVLNAPVDKQVALIQAHPDLAGKAAIAGDLTQESASEQASVGLDRLSPGEYAAFTRLNTAYREKFGFPFVICVREHTRQSILDNFATRLQHSRDQERTTALGEIGKIAGLRLRDLIRKDTTMAIAGENGSIVLGPTSYGKSAVRLVKVDRDTTRHVPHDLNVDVALTGDFDAAYVGDDNTKLLATDTIRNTVYALAKDHPLDSIESFGLALARHFLEVGPTVTGARVSLTEYPWTRIATADGEHDHAFTRDAGERTALVSGTKDLLEISAGIDNMLILKTTNSGWEKFYQEQYTVLPDTNDRILATLLTATWSYGSNTDLDFSALWSGIRAQILETFTDHYSPSVQNTLYRMGKAVLEAFPAVQKIHFALPNKHHLLFNLKQFGMQNDNEIFQVTSDPYGLIEGTVERR